MKKVKLTPEYNHCLWCNDIGKFLDRVTEFEYGYIIAEKTLKELLVSSPYIQHSLKNMYTSSDETGKSYFGKWVIEQLKIWAKTPFDNLDDGLKKYNKLMLLHNHS